MALTGSAVGLPFVIIGAAMAALGVAILLLLAMGVIARPTLQFERAGLRFGQRRYSFLLEWENLAALSPGGWPSWCARTSPGMGLSWW